MHSKESSHNPARNMTRLPVRQSRHWAIRWFIQAVVGLSCVAWAANAFADNASVSASLTPEGGRIVVEAQGLPPKAPFFFSGTASQTIRVSRTEVTGGIRLKLRILQGEPRVLTLGLSGDGEVTDVSGEGLRDWDVRRSAGEGGKRILELRPLSSSEGVLDVLVQTRLSNPTVPGTTNVLLITPGDAVAFISQIILQPDATVDLTVTSAAGLVPAGEPSGTHATRQFVATGDGRLELRITQRGAATEDAELVGAQLSGKVNEAGSSVDFRLRGELRSQKAGSRLRVLTGRAALSNTAVGDGWHVELVLSGDDDSAYDLVSDRQGVVPVDLSFAAAERQAGDWYDLEFTMPAGSVVPLLLEGLGSDVTFKPGTSVVPAATPQGWRGFLPANGVVGLAWKHTRVAAEGALFFTSFELADVRVAAGLLRQSSQLTFRILQGALGSIRCRIDGPSDIVGVEGANVIGWKVVPSGANRALEVRFSRPVETEGSLVVTSQAELGGFPIRAEPLRLTPENGVRHSGFVRVANSGAVRLEVADVTGMMQLAPAQFPGAAVEKGARQVFVYRFPSAAYGYHILGTQIQPEVGVSEITTYELADTDRVINANLELDVREAPLRDWSLQIPSDYAVVAVNGTNVSDYAPESSAADGFRTLKVIFGQPVDGRLLLQLRLEKNQPAAAGSWRLTPIRFPGAKSVRGHIGAVSVPGFRITPSRLDRLTEVPLSYFPTQTAGLQQAWRMREQEWTAEVNVEALGQSVQADVFHLYSLKEGIVYGSVLLNYFVVGAPASEWRVEVPSSVGHIDVVGQNVRRDWRREGDQVIVSLHQPVLGAATLLVTFEQPMSARGGTIRPGEVRPLGVQAERGFIQVVSPLQVKHEIRKAEGGLLKLEATELPAEFRTLTDSPSLAVYQYTARPFSLEMAIDWFAQGETVDQVVDFAKLSSQVARDGQVLTEAQFFLKTRGRQALRMVLPAGAKLWETRVQGEIVNPRIDADQTLIPLPAQMNPNEPVAVTLRLGQAAGSSPSVVALIAPRPLAPIVVSEWTVRSDTGRLLVPESANAELIRPVLTESGFEWISTRARFATVAFLALVLLSVLLLQNRSVWRTAGGLAACAIATIVALQLAVDASWQRRVNLRELKYVTTLVPADGGVSIHIANVGSVRAMLSGWGAAAALVGAGLLVASVVLRQRRDSRFLMLIPIGLILAATGLLAQRGGAILFFGVAAAAVFLLILVPTAVRFVREYRTRPQGPSTGPDPAAVVSGLLLAGIVAASFGGANVLPAQAAPPTWLPEKTVPAQSMVQNWSIRGDRLFAESEVTVRGQPGDTFPLLRAPAVLTDFKGDGLRLGKLERDKQVAYYLVLERAGVLKANIHYEMAVPDRIQGIPVPTGPAAVQRVTVELDQGGWDFISATAAQINPTAGLAENRSGATLTLSPESTPVISLRPKRRDLAAESTQFFAEVANLYVPGPGVVNGFARVAVQPVQGRLTELDFDVPKGLTVGDVNAGPVGTWRFDPQKGRLHVVLEPAQTESFKLDVATQIGAGALPFDISLAPLRVTGASSDAGLIAIAFGGDAQPESVHPTALASVNAQDFDPSLLPHGRDAQPLVTVQQAWRYGPAGGQVALKIAAVAPEIRVASHQVFSLDDDRVVIAADLNVTIARTGIFQISFPLPTGLEVEAVSGPALSHWTEAQEGTQRIVTLHLSGRTIGEQTFALTLTGGAPHAQQAWPIPRLLVREATRQTGELLLVPGKGLRLRAVDRENVTQLDPRQVGGLQPGTLAFRLLQDDWKLRVQIEDLEPWVTVQALQETTVREGQIITRIAARYRVENAAVKQVRVKLPGLGEDRIRTVRASGTAVSDMIKLPGDSDVWEIRFQRGIAGDTDVQIEFQGLTKADEDHTSIITPEFVGARQTTLFAAVRGGGRLELDPAALPRGWTRADWTAVPANLQNRNDRSMPAMCFRVAEPEGALALAVHRHDVAETLKLRVTAADLTTVFSPDGPSLTSVELKVEVLEKSTLRVQLPDGARLFNTFVNGESVSVVRDGDALLFYVSAAADSERSAAVRLVYATVSTVADRVALAGPRLSAPLENVTWHVVVPTGYELKDYRGGLRLQDDRSFGSFGLEQYQALMVSKRSVETQKAVDLLQQANSLLQRGEQQKAGEAFSRVSNARALDEASNEDARVQLRNLKTQQTLVGLNTRRQRLYLDNRADAARNEPLEQAASLNPFMQGKVNFDPQQMDQLLMGNTVEENTALRGIASRLVDQQLSAEPAPGAIDVTIVQRGRVLTFVRALQVDGGAPLELKVTVGRITRTSLVFSLLVLGAAAGIAALRFSHRSHDQR